MNIANSISSSLSLPQRAVQTTLELFDEGATVPFLARYRKERTGGLDEDQLRAIQKLREELTKLEQRRETPSPRRKASLVTDETFPGRPEAVRKQI